MQAVPPPPPPRDTCPARDIHPLAPKELRVRRVTETTISEIAMRWFTQFSSYKGPTSKEALTKLPEAIDLTWSAQCIDDASDFCFVAMKNRTVVGFIVADLIENTKEELILKVHLLITSPSNLLSRTAPGACSSLLRIVENIGASNGAIRSELTSTITACSFYTKQNYTPQDTARPVLYFTKPLLKRPPIAIGEAPLSESTTSTVRFIQKDDFFDTAYENFGDQSECLEPITDMIDTISDPLAIAGNCNARGKFDAIFLLDLTSPYHFRVIEHANISGTVQACKNIFCFLRNKGASMGRIVIGDLPMMAKKRKSRS